MLVVSIVQDIEIISPSLQAFGGLADFASEGISSIASTLECFI